MKNAKFLIFVIILLFISGSILKSQTIFGIDISSTKNTDGWILEKEYKKKANEYAKYDVSIWDKISMIEEEGYIFNCKQKDMQNYFIAINELLYSLGQETRNESWYESGYYQMDSYKDKEYYISRGKAYFKDIWETEKSMISLIYDINSIRINVKFK